MQIEGHHIDVRGVSGLKVEKLDGMLKDVVQKPNTVYCCVVVQICSSDLGDRDKTADSAAKEMLKMCVRLRDEFGVNRVILYEVIERFEVNKWMQFELDEYNDRVRLFNHLADQMCESVQGITYRWHKKEAMRLSIDGIHVRYCWMEKYWRSIEAGVYKAIRMEGENEGMGECSNTALPTDK